MGTHFDVIIIGTGAGGGTLALSLARTGKKILLVERGGWLPREKENWRSEDVILGARYKAHETWLDKDDRPFHPSTHYWVGGNTKVYGAALVRFRESDFGEVEHLGGKSPAWPLSYADFEPYYAQAERLYKVHGTRGVDPTEPWESTPYDHPAMSHEPAMAELVDALTKGGYRPFAMPLGVQIDEATRHRSTCIRCNTCDGFPCLVGGKSDAQVVAVEPALAHPNVSILTGATAQRLVTDASGRSVKTVIVERDGVSEELSADLVVVSCGAINSAALLLRSASDAHPDGLANSSGAVGRHYMAHQNSIFFAITTRRNPTSFQKTMGLNDFYLARDGEGPLGHVSMVGKSDENLLAAGAPLAPKCLLKVMARHAFDFWLTSEDLPDPDNRVTLGPSGQVKVAYTPNNVEAHARLTRRLKGIVSELLPLGVSISARMPVAATAHQCGTLRMGADPRTSVLDRTCKAHDLDNLYVVDASFFPSSAAMNPALTIMANALRVGDHLRERLAA